MKNIEITDKRIVLGVIIGLLAMYLMGFMMCNKMRGEVEFTKADIRAIESAMDTYGDTVIVIKDKKGNLILNLGEVD